MGSDLLVTRTWIRSVGTHRVPEARSPRLHGGHASCTAHSRSRWYLPALMASMIIDRRFHESAWCQQVWAASLMDARNPQLRLQAAPGEPQSAKRALRADWSAWLLWALRSCALLEEDPGLWELIEPWEWHPGELTRSTVTASTAPCRGGAGRLPYCCGLTRKGRGGGSGGAQFRSKVCKSYSDLSLREYLRRGRDMLRGFLMELVVCSLTCISCCRDRRLRNDWKGSGVTRSLVL